jgi:hypothetical protein
MLRPPLMASVAAVGMQACKLGGRSRSGFAGGEVAQQFGDDLSILRPDEARDLFAVAQRD